jgi:hypothetical protein
MEQPKIDFSPQQIQIAASAGLQLLSTQGAVNVPGPMAVSGVIKTLAQLLTAIVNQEVMIVNIPVKLAEAPPAAPPNKEVAAAVAAAIENNGKGEASPIAPVESEETPPAANEAEAAEG